MNDFALGLDCDTSLKLSVSAYNWPQPSLSSIAVKVYPALSKITWTTTTTMTLTAIRAKRSSCNTYGHKFDSFCVFPATATTGVVVFAVAVVAPNDSETMRLIYLLSQTHVPHTHLSHTHHTLITPTLITQTLDTHIFFVLSCPPRRNGEQSQVRSLKSSSKKYF